MCPQLHAYFASIFVMHRPCCNRRAWLIAIKHKMRFEGVEQRSCKLGEKAQWHLTGNHIVV